MRIESTRIRALGLKSIRVLKRKLNRVRPFVFGFSGPKESRLSIIVPCYKVENYLDATLNSIQKQSYRNLEIIVVDDGSPDRSGEIAKEHARRDRRIKVIRQENAGLGAARNTGLRAATGAFIAFCDSDDTIPQGAYAAMMASLAKTGSDFVVGGVERRFGSNRWIPLWAQQVHARDLLGITLADLPTVLQDVFAWNKVFRREFFLQEVREFPVGIRYEDQAPTARAYTAAKSFDVLSKIVYTWVIRDDGSSITQGKTQIRDLQDRLAVKKSVAQILGSRGPQTVYEYWLAKAIGFDLESYFVQIPRTDEVYWDTLRAGVVRLAGHLGEASWDQVKFHDRIKIACAIYGSSEDVSTVVTELEETTDGFELIAGPDGVEVSADYLDDLTFEVPASVRSARPVDFESRARLLGCAWVGRGILEVSMQVMLMGFSGSQEDGGLFVEILDSKGDAVISSRASRSSIVNPNEIAADAYADHSEDVFTARLDLRELASVPHGHGDDTWRVRVRRSTTLGDFDTYLTRRSLLSSAATFPHGRLVDGERLALRWDVGLGLSINRPQPHALASGLHIDGRRVTLDMVRGGSPHADTPVHELRIRHKWSGTSVSCAPTTVFEFGARFTFELPVLPEKYRRGVQRWRIRVKYVDGTSELLQFDGNETDLYSSARQGARVAPTLTANGFLQLEDATFGGCVSEVSLNSEGGEISVVGQLDFDHDSGKPQIALVSGQGVELHAAVQEISGGVLKARIPLSQVDGSYAPTGGYSLRGRTVRDASAEGDVSAWRWLPVAPELTRKLPEYYAGDLAEVRFSRTEKARSLWVNVYAPYGGIERGRYGSRSFQQKLALEDLPLVDSIFFESYGGRSCTDSPAALAAELRRRGDVRPQFFGVKDRSVLAPEGTTPVVIGSAQYRRLLRSCKWLVNNNNFPYYFRKRPGQKYIQTWHGTPLKRIGNDVPGVNLSLSYRALMKREAEYWDVLLSQNEYSTKILPSAFDYRGTVLTSGYPRNNELFTGDADAHRDAMREELGVGDGVLAVLYAPTWRDNVKANGGAYKMVSYLDLDDLESRLGRNFVVLQRGHSNTASTVSVSKDPRVVDVTNHSDLNGLFLASDVLVTDYSSIFFDYSCTNKPILFLVPDLDDYAGTTRGFYVDLSSVAPGPLCSDSAEIATWLADMERLRGKFKSSYAEFRNRFTGLDDAETVSRVVDSVL